MSRRREKRESKTMTHLPPISIQYIKDDSVNSHKRSNDVVELLFQIVLHKPKRGRPRTTSNAELDNVA